MFGICVVWELQCFGVGVCERCGMSKLQCLGLMVVFCGSRGVKEEHRKGFAFCRSPGKY